MYIRAKTFKRKKDEKRRTYYYLVESKKNNGNVNQKVILYLGSAESILKSYKELDILRKELSTKRN